MKLRLILSVLLLLPFTVYVKGQNDVVFYSKAKMYVGPQTASADSTTLFIDGSVKFFNSAEAIAFPQTGSVVQNGVTEIKGDFIDAVTAGGPLFMTDARGLNGTGAFLFSKTDSTQRIYRLESEFNAATPAVTNSNARRENYINFPTVRVRQNRLTQFNHNTALLVDTAVAIIIDTLDLTNGTRPDRFVAKASYTQDATHAIKSSYVSIRAIKDMDATGAILGISQLDFTLYDAADEAGTNVSPKQDAARPDVNYKYMTGFTPPFVTMGNDYTYYQTVGIPFMKEDGSLDLTDSIRMRPDLVFKGGRGYFLAMEVSRNQTLEDDIAANWFEGYSNAKNYRALGTYNFARSFRNAWRDSVVAADPQGPKLQKLSVFANSNNIGTDFITTADITGHNKGTIVVERFVTDDVKIALEHGTNFLGNPFLAPLDLSDIATATDGTVLTDFGVTVSDGNSASGDIRNKIWLVQESRIGFFYLHWKYLFSIKYYDSAQGGIGGTLPLDQYHVGPMQMFIVQARNTGTIASKITLPASKRTVQSSVRTPRSAPQRQDDFVFQLTNMETQGEDRTCIVLREGFSTTSSDLVESPKGVIKSQLKSLEDADSDDAKRFDSFIYSKSSDGLAMLTNAMPLGTKEVALFVTGGDQATHMRIKSERTESMYNVREMWLHDKVAKKFIELSQDTEYDFVLQPNETDRFSVVFGKPDEPTISTESNPISCYYSQSTLYLVGVNDNDINSVVDIYDMQGRQITRTTIKNIADNKTEFSLALTQGTYVVRMKGKRNFTGKFISLQKN